MTLPFAEPIVEQALARAQGRCECQSSSPCKHTGRCKNMINKEKRGSTGYGGWDVKPINPKSPPKLSNCMIVCSGCLKLMNP